MPSRADTASWKKAYLEPPAGGRLGKRKKRGKWQEENNRQNRTVAQTSVGISPSLVWLFTPTLPVLIPGSELGGWGLSGAWKNYNEINSADFFKCRSGNGECPEWSNVIVIIRHIYFAFSVIGYSSEACGHIWHIDAGEFQSTPPAGDASAASFHSFSVSTQIWAHITVSSLAKQDLWPVFTVLSRTIRPSASASSGL